ncbi:MAG: hypothetical protein JSR19_06380 [Proteobacteria bacterium]|nr:hypothetical protein [Pseudomonadota bacterium]HQR05037.1 hypothetical protein [Rhodocyclaceae bacterium]
MRFYNPHTLLRPWPALLAALLLVLGQQAALSHLLSHLGTGQAIVAQEEDAGHETARTISHVCATCVVVADLLGGAPPSWMPPSAPRHAVVAITATVTPLLLRAASRPWDARGPPHTLPS